MRYCDVAEVRRVAGEERRAGTLRTSWLTPEAAAFDARAYGVPPQQMTERMQSAGDPDGAPVRMQRFGRGPAEVAQITCSEYAEASAST